MEMKKNRLLLLLSSGFILLVLFTPVALSNDFGINEFFTKKEKILELMDPSTILVQGEKFTITEGEYVDYKENLKMVYQLNGNSFDITDEEVMDRIIENKLLLQIADEQGITVTKDDVQEYALQTKEAFEQNVSSELNQIHLELAKQLSVSPEDYFTHPDVLKQYEEIVKLNKLVDNMVLEGKINDDYSISEFVQDIKVEYKDTYNINK